MEKRLLIALGLSVLILVAWQWVFPPPKAPAVPEPRAQSTAAAAAAPETGKTTTAAVPTEAPAPVVEEEPEEATAEEEVRVRTDLFEVVLTNRGGRATSWRLHGYTDSAENPLELVPPYAAKEHRWPLGVELPGDAERTQAINHALFRVERSGVPAGPKGDAGEKVTFTWADGHGLRVTKSLVLRHGDYLAELELNVTDRGRRLPARIVWGPGFEAQDVASTRSRFHYHGQVVWDVGGNVVRHSARKVKEPMELSIPSGLYWAGLEDQYFAALVLPAGGSASVRVWPEEVEVTVPGKKGKPETIEKQRRSMMAVGVPAEGALLYVGPKKYTLLEGLGHQLDRVVWFSSNALLGWVAKLLFLALLWTHDHVIGNYGLAIILATVILRVLLFPLNQYSMVSMKRMQEDMKRIQPKINAIKNKYRKKKDAESRAKMNQEMMALYKKEGVNPAGGMTGCLPLLIQFPILIGFYNMLTVAVELRGSPFFGWIRDLTVKDPYYITPILMGVTMFVQQKMSATKVGDPTQQKIMTMMPIVFTLMFLNLPSGLVLYWFVNNLLGIGQQWLVNRHVGRLAAAAKPKKA